MWGKYCSLISVCLCVQAVEGVVLLPKNHDFSQIGVKSKDLHFITAGSKGSALELSRLPQLCFCVFCISPPLTFLACRCIESVGGQHGALCLHPDPHLHPSRSLWGGRGGRERRRPPQSNVSPSPAGLLQTGHSHSRTQHSALPAAWSHHAAAGRYWGYICVEYLDPVLTTTFATIYDIYCCSLRPPSLSLWATVTRCWTWSFWVKMTATSWWPPTAASWRCLSFSPTAARSSTDTQVSHQQRAVCVCVYMHVKHIAVCVFAHQRAESIHSVTVSVLPHRGKQQEIEDV